MTKTVLVTGGTSGIGAAAAKEFASKGYNVRPPCTWVGIDLLASRGLASPRSRAFRASDLSRPPMPHKSCSHASVTLCC